MADIFGWITFKEIIDETNLAGGDSSDDGQFLRKLGFAVRGYEHIRIAGLPAVKTISCDISAEIRAIALPEDFLKFKSVGTLYQDRFAEYLPKDILDYTTMNCGVDDREVRNPDSTWRKWNYYTLDRENRRILIDAPIDVQTVILNYTPTGIKTDGTTYIPRICKELLIVYIEWQMALHDKVPAIDKALFKDEYTKELNKFIGLTYDTDALWMEYYKHLRNSPTY
jgi:hypothetical protein